MYSFETEFMEEKWQKDFAQLEDDFDSLRQFFNNHKECKCHIDECVHFDKALSEVMGEKIQKICNSRLDIGLRTYYENKKSLDSIS